MPIYLFFVFVFFVFLFLLRVEYELRYLAVLDRRAVVVTRGVAKLEIHFAITRTAVHSHFPESLRPVMGIRPLKSIQFSDKKNQLIKYLIRKLLDLSVSKFNQF